MAETPADALRAELLAWLGSGPAPGGDEAHEDRFRALAVRVFRHNVEHCAPYGAYCRRRGITPDTVEDWRDIPAVPTSAFKELELVSGEKEDAVLTFRTSGTTRGRKRRGVHHVLDPALYDAALLPTFVAYLLPDGATLPMVSLIPSPADQPDSSLSYMVGAVIEAFGDEGGRYVAGPDGLDLDRLDALVAAGDRPVCLLGTSAAFIHWLGALDRDGRRLRLPEGSRLMDTGGYKGRGRAVDEAELRRAYVELLGLAEGHCVNEYGMTELLSQFYDTILRDRCRGAGGGARRKQGPRWVRTLVVDPETLRPLPAGETGVLAHYDLANMDAVMAVQTEDLGVAVDDGFRLLGRSAEAPPRGCSVAMDMLLQDRDAS